MKVIKPLLDHLNLLLANLKRVFGIFYTKDLYPQYKDCIGDHTYGLPKIIKLEKNSKFKIGKFCSIANEVTILVDG